MAEFFAKQISTRQLEDRVEMVFEVPAFTANRAETRAKKQMRGKGFNSPRANDSTVVKNTNIPGQSIYEVTVSAAN